MSIYTDVCLSIQDALLYIPILYSLSQSYPLLSISPVLPLLPQLRTRLDSKNYMDPVYHHDGLGIARSPQAYIVTSAGIRSDFFRKSRIREYIWLSENCRIDRHDIVLST